MNPLERLYLKTKAGQSLKKHIADNALSRNKEERRVKHDGHLQKAKTFRSQGRSLEAATRYRRALLEDPSRTQTWIDYAFELIKAGRIEVAHEAFSNALDLDPSNPVPLEMIRDTGFKLGRPPAEHKRLVRNATKTVHGKSRRHLDLLEIAYPYGTEKLLGAIANSEDDIARALLALSIDPTRSVSEVAKHLSPEIQRNIEARFLLLQGRYSNADTLLSKMRPQDLPVSTLRRIAKRQAGSGRHQNALLAIKHLLRADPKDAWALKKYSEETTAYRTSTAAVEKVRLIDQGFNFSRKAGSPHSPVGNSGLYLLHNSLPYSSAGYATRSHGLISNIRSQGFDVSGVTRPGFPFDRPEARGHNSDIPRVDTVDGVPYYRLSTAQETLPKHPLIPYVAEYSRRLEKLARETSASFIHAASNHWNGLAAVETANRLGIPSIYEVRGLWEITRISREPQWINSVDFDFMASMEAEAATGATHVLAITQALKDEMVSRGVPAAKIDIIPNGVNSGRFLPRMPNSELKNQLGIAQEDVVIGYVGSVLDYEGIGTLIEAVSMLATTYKGFHLLIVGDGSYLDSATDLVEAYSLEEITTFTGRVPHAEVEDYYSIIDIAPIPRHALPVTEMVSPLKPFEAMAMGKTVIGSDVSAIKEIIIDGVNGMTFKKDDPGDLARVLAGLLDDPGEVSRIGRSAREWVESERDWKHIAADVASVYRRLLE